MGVLENIVTGKQTPRGEIWPSPYRRVKRQSHFRGKKRKKRSWGSSKETFSKGRGQSGS